VCVAMDGWDDGVPGVASSTSKESVASPGPPVRHGSLLGLCLRRFGYLEGTSCFERHPLTTDVLEPPALSLPCHSSKLAACDQM
jgi:hypothetical protein